MTDENEARFNRRAFLFLQRLNLPAPAATPHQKIPKKELKRIFLGIANAES